jgi:hypothetical protein
VLVVNDVVNVMAAHQSVCKLAVGKIKSALILLMDGANMKSPVLIYLFLYFRHPIFVDFLQLILPL